MTHEGIQHHAKMILSHLSTDIDRLHNFWVPDPYILHQRSLFSAAIMKNSEALRLYPDHSLKYGVIQHARYFYLMHKPIKHTDSHLFRIGCEMQFHHYPSDNQTCSIFLISFGFTEDVLKFVWGREVRIRPHGPSGGVIHVTNYKDLGQ